MVMLLLPEKARMASNSTKLKSQISFFYIYAEKLKAGYHGKFTKNSFTTGKEILNNMNFWRCLFFLAQATLDFQKQKYE